jgi:guanylate kinase
MSSRRGNLVIISSPSGAGKTTLARRLLGEFPDLSFSVSYTTRPPRKGEVDGKDYYFVSADKFTEMVAAGAFAEWAHVHSNRYGTARTVVESALAEGQDVVFDVDWQGGRKLMESFPKDSLSIFILPPDTVTLEKRLRSRATDSEEVIQRRLENAFEEIRHFHEYEFAIVNDDLERAYAALRSIYVARRENKAGHPEYRSARASEHVKSLLAGR